MIVTLLTREGPGDNSACLRTAHARSIELTLAGRGPTERRPRKLSGSPVRDGVIEHPSASPSWGLRLQFREADLYVHAARIEVEARCS